jgi:aspartate racemase
MKTVGIIGGLGPETTAKFYLEVLSSCFKFHNLGRPPMVIFNVPMSFKLEEEIITASERTDFFVPFLTDAAIRLEKSGVDFIVIPCNTAHVFIDQVRKSVNIPILSIVEESVRFLTDQRMDRIGLLGTTQTIETKLFDNECRQNGIKINKPSLRNQLQIASIITKIVKNNHSLSDQKKLLKIIDDFKDSDCILLACTDLQLLVSNHKSLKIFDTMKILADATVREILKGGE